MLIKRRGGVLSNKINIVLMLLLFFIINTYSKEFVIENIEIRKDSVHLSKVYVILTFNNRPVNFPVYAMTDPERIIIDCANTKVKIDVKPDKTDTSFIKDIQVIEKTIEKKPNTRIEVFIKVNAFFRAHISDKRIILSVNQTGEIKKTVSLFRAEEIKTDIPAIQSLDITSMERNIEIALAFSSLPKAASVYKLESPPRIIMDFYNVFIKEGFEKEVDIAPIKKITVIKKDVVQYVGIIVHLSRSAPFQYGQLNSRMIVDISLEKVKLSKRKKIILIGSGILLTGGVVTGIIMGTDDSKGGSGDLGSPPGFPDGPD